MPVTAADLKFFASNAMTDAPDGGGGRSATVLQNGVAGQIFPDVSAGDRSTGRTRLRKFYPSVTNIDNAALLAASVAINEVPTDPATTVSLFAFGDATTTRATAIQALERSSATRLLPVYHRYSPTSANTATTILCTWTGGGTVLTYTFDVGRLGPAASNYVRIVPQNAGTYIKISSYPSYVTALAADELGADIFTPGPGTRTITVTSPLPGSGAQTSAVTLEEVVTLTVPLYGVMNVPGITASGANLVVVTQPVAQVVPYDGVTYPTANNGIEPSPFRASFGTALIARVNDQVTLWHEEGTTPATATNGGTVNVGRTNLDQMAVVGADGAEIARFLAGGPTPPGGSCTADLTTGILTFVNVSGFSQPVSVRHRISHRSNVASISANDITISDVTTRAFPASSKLSTHLKFGDLAARAFGSFGQQAWTRVFSDVLIGNSVGRQYTGDITVTNQGAENDRWALVFTSATSFQCFSELRGLIGTGTTTSNYAPVNSATGAPFFTLSSGAWAPSILVGSVFRFNTEGANRAVWALQCINPSAAAGVTRTAVRLHGSV